MARANKPPIYGLQCPQGHRFDSGLPSFPDPLPTSSLLVTSCPSGMGGLPLDIRNTATETEHHQDPSSPPHTQRRADWGTFTHAHTHTRTHTYKHTHIHMHTHMQTQTHTHTLITLGVLKVYLFFILLCILSFVLLSSYTLSLEFSITRSLVFSLTRFFFCLSHPPSLTHSLIRS